MGNERHPVAGETWTFDMTGLYGPRKIKSVVVLGYHEPSHTVWGQEKGDSHPSVYQPHQWRLWKPPKPTIPDFTRYIHVGETVKTHYHPDGIRTSTRREDDLPPLHIPNYPYLVKLVVKDGKATATVLD